MFGAYVRFKCNYAALRKSSDNQLQLLLGQHHHKGEYWTFGLWFIRIFGKFNSLRNTQTLRHVHIQSRNTT